MSRAERLQKRNQAKEKEEKAPKRKAINLRAAEGRVHERIIKPDDINTDYRKIVVLEPIGRWYADNIAFFQSSGHNKGLGFLKNTYLPTLGEIDSDTPLPNFMDKTLKGHGIVLIKTSYFKTLFEGKKDGLGFETEIPEWIHQLIMEYSERYPNLFGSIETYSNPVTNIVEAKELHREMIEIQHIYMTLKTYFTSHWQVAMSIGLSRFMGEGIWIGELANFAAFMDTKMVCNIRGVKDSEQHTDMTVFLTTKGAQSTLDFTEDDALENRAISTELYHILHNRSPERLEQTIRAYEVIARFKKGGTKRKRLLKTRRQKKG